MPTATNINLYFHLTDWVRLLITAFIAFNFMQIKTAMNGGLIHHSMPGRRGIQGARN